MRIGIDIDGTLTNIVDSVIAYGQEYELENNLKEGIANPKSDFIQTAFEWGTEIGNRFWRENFVKINQVEPRPLTKKYLDKLHNEGHEIIIITARSDEELKTPEKISIKWLKKNKLPFDKIVVNANDKGKVCKENNIDVFIDDLPRNIDRVVSTGIKTFIMNSVTNEHFNIKGVTRVYSFVDFYRHIKKMSQTGKKPEIEGMPKTYAMNVNKIFYKKLKRGDIKIELRLNDIRRQNIKKNDTINFKLDTNPKKSFFAKVERTKKYKNFIELLQKEGLENCGFRVKSIQQADSIMKRFYSQEEIQKLGVIAIEIKLKK
ncbi:MAG: hypothetical protein PHS54_02780 [Clostridia bacterium]|nr:hypothetical protein [Clostridia bacterium]